MEDKDKESSETKGKVIGKKKTNLSLYKSKQQRRSNESSDGEKSRGRPKKRKGEVQSGNIKPKVSKGQYGIQQNIQKPSDGDSEVEISVISDSEGGEDKPRDEKDNEEENNVLEQSFIVTSGAFTVVSDEEIKLQNVPTDNRDNTGNHPTNFKEKCKNILRDASILDPLVDKLSNENLLGDFVKLIQLLSSGEFSVLNIVFLLLLDRIRWQSQKTTTQMRYHTVTMRFWAAMYILCGGVGITFCAGMKNKTQVMTDKTEKGCYDPSDAEINFAVPDERHLRNFNRYMPKDIQPGQIEASYDLLKGEQDRILMADLKSLSEGFRRQHEGDVNLWGHEYPRLDNLDQSLDTHMKFADTIWDDILKYGRVKQTQSLRKMLHLITKEMEKVRRLQLKAKKKLHKYEKATNASVKAYIYVVSDCKTYLQNSNLWVEKCAQLQKGILHHLADMWNSEHLLCKDDNVILSESANARQLHTVEYVRKHVDIEEKTEMVRQGSDPWMKSRLSCPTTGSTTHNAIGLRDRKSLNEHYDEFIYKKGPKQFTEEQQKRLDHGRTNEINAIATLVGTVMPGLLPTCSKWYECGTTLMDGTVKKPLIAISPDGVIRWDRNPSQICDYPQHAHMDYAIEVKCPYPGYFNLPVHYAVPKYYITQILMEMKACNTEKLLYISYGKLTTTFIECTFDVELFNAITAVMRGDLDKEKPVKPKQIVTRKKEFNVKFENYQRTHCKLLCEVPSKLGSHGTLVEKRTFHPYHVCYKEHTGHRYNDEADQDDAVAMLADLLDEFTSLMKEGYELQRQPASDIVTFAASHFHRKNENGIPASVPIAYGLSGHSMTNKTMRKMVNDVRDTCKDKSVGILCEVYDGQFFNLVMRSEKDEPLSKFQLMRDIWKPISKMSVVKCLNYLLWYCSMNRTDLMRLGQINPLLPGQFASVGNLVVQCPRTQKRVLVCRMNKHADQVQWADLVQQKILTLDEGEEATDSLPHRQNERPVIRRNLTEAEIDMLLKDTKKGRRRKAKQQLFTVDVETDLDYDSSDDLDYLPEEDSASEASEDSSADLSFEEEVLESTLETDLDTSTCEFLNYCLTQLQKFINNHDWNAKTVGDLYDNFLCDVTHIENLYSYELDEIMKAIEVFTGIKIFNVSDKKKTKVSQLARNFGNDMELLNTTSIIQTVAENRQSQKTVPTLKYLSQSQILTSGYPVVSLQVNVAECRMKDALQKWKNNATVPLTITIPGVTKDHHVHSYPEFCDKRAQLEPRTFDPSHILSNIRSHLCNRGYAKYERQAWIKVSEVDHEVLPRTIIEDQLDRQNTAISYRFFSVKVEDIMRKNGYMAEAELCRIIRSWYEACDDRGIEFEERMRRLQETYDFVLENFPLQFPAQSQYIAGMPIRTYDALLQSISMRFILIHLKGSGINPRAISTLDIESLYSDLSRTDFTGLGKPKAADIPKILAKVIALNNIKHNPNRGFVFFTTVRAKYPYHEFEVSVLSNSSRFSSILDMPRHGKKKKKCSTISKPRSVTKGALPVRQYHRIDESKIEPHKRAGYSLDFDLTNY